MNTECENLLKHAAVKPTPNRLLVLNALHGAESPRSLVELETELETLDRSSILRVLTLLLSHHIIHQMEDGRGVTKYELCHSDHCHTDDDMHVHFYCEKCQRTYCFDNIVAPRVSVPEGYQVHGMNYMLKGLCPNCKTK